MQEGAGGRERERDKHRHQRQAHTPPPQNPGYGAGMSRVASAPAPVLFPILTLGCPSEEQLQNTALNQAGDAPVLFRAGLFGKGSCRWQAGVRVSEPTVSKPSRRTRWQQEAPNRGGGGGEDAEPEAGLSNMAEGMETPRRHVYGLQG